jgi:hypothetical protein
MVDGLVIMINLLNLKILSKKDVVKILQDKTEKNFYYDFGDGWGANVNVSIITAKQRRELKKISGKFMGYEWMIEEILKYGKYNFKNIEELKILLKKNLKKK